MLRLCDISGELGCSGLSYYYFKKPMGTLDTGLVQLKTNEDVAEMCMWVPACKNLDVYVIHPYWTRAKNDLLYEMYMSLRQHWPKAELRELNEEEAAEFQRELNEVEAKFFLKAQGEKQHYYLEWKPNVDNVAEVVGGEAVAEANVDNVDNVDSVEAVVYNVEEVHGEEGDVMQGEVEGRGSTGGRR